MIRSEEISIRVATPEDAKPLSELAANTFRDSFAAQNDPADIYKYVQESFSLEKFQAELADTRNSTFFIMTSSKNLPCGYAKLRRSSSEECVSGPKPIELERLYVNKSIIRQRLGSWLLQTCIDHAVSLGYETLWLGVWDQNARAIAFYKTWEFQTVGSHVFTLGSDNQNDLIMQRAMP